MAERLVRFAQSFFDHLDSLFDAERGADGTPSSMDFLLYDLPRIRDRLADDFEANTMAVAEVAELRVLIGAGVLAPTVAVYAYLVTDHIVEVIGLSLGTGWRGSLSGGEFCCGCRVLASVSSWDPLTDSSVGALACPLI